MVVDLIIAVLAAFAGLVAMLWLLLLWVGDGLANPVVPHADDPITGPRDPVAIHDSDGPFIPMPERLKTRDEMVAWMTEELPKLAAASPRPGG